MNRSLTTRMHLKNFAEKAIPYNTIVEEDFDNKAILLSVRFPWWTWKIPHFARENKVIINRIKRQINRYKTAYVEYRIKYKV